MSLVRLTGPVIPILILLLIHPVEGMKIWKTGQPALNLLHLCTHRAVKFVPRVLSIKLSSSVELEVWGDAMSVWGGSVATPTGRKERSSTSSSCVKVSVEACLRREHDTCRADWHGPIGTEKAPVGIRPEVGEDLLKHVIPNSYSHDWTHDGDTILKSSIRDRMYRG